MSDPDPTASGEANQDTPIPRCIRFSTRGENGETLIATLEPRLDYPSGFSVSQIREWIARQGCGNWLMREETIMRFARESRRLEQAGDYVVAERTDCKIDIQISPDRLKAWITAQPGYGGQCITEDLLRRTLAEQHILFGINEALVQQIVRDGGCEKCLIAEGTAPVQGEPARFKPLVKESEHKGIPQEKEHGRVDYKDLGLFTSVTKGTPLLKRIPPSAGIPGTGVNGRPIPAPSGTDRALLPGAGTTISKEDPDVIIASRVGQPSFMENTVRVDPTLEVNSVDPSTGNIVFEGNILVRGSVESGFTVKAGQDLTILDTVEGADLTAGKHLLLLTGVYGRTKSQIAAGGNIEARFLSDCTVRCRGDIEVSDLIAHCDVECEGALRIGKHGGKGQGFGGRLMALRGVEARILGSISEAPTLVEVAAPRDLIERKALVDAEIRNARRDLEFAEKELRSIADEKEYRAASIRNKCAALSARIDEKAKEQNSLQAKLALLEKARIKAAEVHRGVTLMIGRNRQIAGELMNDVNLAYE